MARAVFALLLAGVLTLAGCATIADLGKLRDDLRSAGYDANSVDHNTTNGVSVLRIGVSMPDGEPADADADAEKVAEVAWTTYPGDIDRIVVELNGDVRLDATRDELTTRFGERPGDLANSGDANSDDGSPVLTVVLILAGAAVFAGLMVLLWRRNRRPPPPFTPPPAPYGHPPRS